MVTCGAELVTTVLVRVRVRVRVTYLSLLAFRIESFLVTFLSIVL